MFFFSFTHIVPYWKGRKIKEGIIRLDIGGKLLTNYLKETISYRQLNLMDEFRVVDKIKEQSCYCSVDYRNDMKNFEKQAKVRKTTFFNFFSLYDLRKL